MQSGDSRVEQGETGSARQARRIEYTVVSNLTDQCLGEQLARLVGSAAYRIGVDAEPVTMIAGQVEQR